MREIEEKDIELCAFEFLRKIYYNQIAYGDEIIEKAGDNWKVVIKDMRTGKTRYLRDTREKRGIILLIDPESVRVIQFTIEKDFR